MHRLESRLVPGKYVAPSTYIAELVCEKTAKHRGIELPPSFKELPEWKFYYVRQIMKAKELVGLFNYKDIIEIVNKHNVFSLHVKFVIPKLEEIKNRAKPTKEVRSIEDNTNSIGRSNKPKITLSDIYDEHSHNDYNDHNDTNGQNQKN